MIRSALRHATLRSLPSDPASFCASLPAATSFLRKNLLARPLSARPVDAATVDDARRPSSPPRSSPSKEPPALSAPHSQPSKAKPLASYSTRRPGEATMGDQLRELKRASIERGGTASVDDGLLAPGEARPFPALDMVSLEQEAVVIRDEAARASVTLVLLAYRSFADDQIASWRAPYDAAFATNDRAQVFDVAVNESFAARMLSGFVQRFQKGKVVAALHHNTVAYNVDACKRLEALLPSRNRLFGYALLLDREGRVRFRAAGMATSEARATMVTAAKQLLLDEERAQSGKKNGSGVGKESPARPLSYRGAQVV